MFTKESRRLFRVLAIGCAASLLFNAGQALADPPPPPNPGVNVLPSAGESPGCNRLVQARAAKYGARHLLNSSFSSYDDCIKEHPGLPKEPVTAPRETPAPPVVAANPTTPPEPTPTPKPPEPTPTPKPPEPAATPKLPEPPVATPKTSDTVTTAKPSDVVTTPKGKTAKKHSPTQSPKAAKRNKTVKTPKIAKKTSKSHKVKTTRVIKRAKKAA